MYHELADDGGNEATLLVGDAPGEAMNDQTLPAALKMDESSRPVYWTLEVHRINS